MTSVALTIITLILALCGVSLGSFFAGRLRKDELTPDSKDFVKVVAGFMTTMAALLLSLQLSSARTSFDNQELQVADVSSKIVFLDRALANSGYGSKAARATLHDLVAGMLQHAWPDTFHGAHLTTPPGVDVLYDNIEQISPANESQRFAKSNALGTALDVAKTLRFISEEQSSSTTLPLLAVEISWTTLIFIYFGLLAPRNGTALTALTLSALAVAIAIFLIAEMSSPFSGVIRISGAPLEDALRQIGR